MPDQTLPPPGPVLVTGGNGYVASWLVKRLLESGCDVHATVRDPGDPKKTAHRAKSRPATPARCPSSGPTFWIPAASTAPWRVARWSSTPPRPSSCGTSRTR
ncbi:MAG: NAD-dependent epimerase/dehydratase family protein [Gemmatimonadota bacterium]|nr:NAD-dependent epimerase/dehydratase family protein [Gemmatimonadota bacterium]